MSNHPDGTPHDGAQSQLPDRDVRPPSSEPDPNEPVDVPSALPSDAPVPVSARPTGDSTGLGTSPPGMGAANVGRTSVAAPGQPDGEVDTRR